MNLIWIKFIQGLKTALHLLINWTNMKIKYNKATSCSILEFLPTLSIWKIEDKKNLYIDLRFWRFSFGISLIFN